MINNQAYVFILHGAVRAMLLSCSVNDACLAIYKSVFPCVVRRKFFLPADKLPASHFQEICDFLYEMDKQEIGYGSCYSASLVVHLVAFVHGIESEMILGVKKQDEKLVGHAWVLLKYGPSIQEINPGNVSTKDYKVISRFTADKIIQNWVEAKCDTGP